MKKSIRYLKKERYLELAKDKKNSNWYNIHKMKKILFFIILCISIIASCKTTPNAKDTKISDFVGEWYFSADDETLDLDLELTKNNGIIGKYCNIAYNGNRIDCSPDDEKNITGVLKNDTLYLKFSGFYDESARGEAKLYRKNDQNENIKRWRIFENEEEEERYETHTDLVETRITSLGKKIDVIAIIKSYDPEDISM